LAKHAKCPRNANTHCSTIPQ